MVKSLFFFSMGRSWPWPFPSDVGRAKEWIARDVSGEAQIARDVWSSGRKHGGAHRWKKNHGTSNYPPAICYIANWKMAIEIDY